MLVCISLFLFYKLRYLRNTLNLYLTLLAGSHYSFNMLNCSLRDNSGNSVVSLMKFERCGDSKKKHVALISNDIRLYTENCVSIKERDNTYYVKKLKKLEENVYKEWIIKSF